MQQDQLGSIIEKYKQELLAFQQKNASMQMLTEVVNAAEEVPVRDFEQEDGVVQMQEEVLAPFDPVVEEVPPQPQPIVPLEECQEQTELPDYTGDGITNEELQTLGQIPTYEGVTEAVYESYNDFLQQNPHRGTLRVVTYAGQEAYPVANVRVVVSKEIAGRSYVFYDRLTNADGLVTGLSLPAPAANLSDQPGTVAPFAVYDITVEHPDYVKSIYRSAVIFAQNESVQSVRLVPQDGNQGEIVYFENSYTR